MIRKRWSAEITRDEKDEITVLQLSGVEGRHDNCLQSYEDCKRQKKGSDYSVERQIKKGEIQIK